MNRFISRSQRIKITFSVGIVFLISLCYDQRLPWRRRVFLCGFSSPAV